MSSQRYTAAAQAHANNAKRRTVRRSARRNWLVALGSERVRTLMGAPVATN